MVRLGAKVSVASSRSLLILLDCYLSRVWCCSFLVPKGYHYLSIFGVLSFYIVNYTSTSCIFFICGWFMCIVHLKPFGIELLSSC